MSADSVITLEEYEVVNNVAAGFIQRMKRDPRWETDDVRQELLVFWLKKKQSGWQKPREWKGAMGRCLQLHLISLSKKESAKKRHAPGAVLPLAQLIEEGREFPDPKPAPIPLDFLDLVSRQEREICQLLMQGYSKAEIATRLNLSLATLHRRIRNVRKVYVQNS